MRQNNQHFGMIRNIAQCWNKHIFLLQYQNCLKRMTSMHVIWHNVKTVVDSYLFLYVSTVRLWLMQLCNHTEQNVMEAMKTPGTHLQNTRLEDLFAYEII